MAFVIIGGLIISTGLTLVVVPLIFRLVGAGRAAQLISTGRQGGSHDQVDKTINPPASE